MYILLSLQLKTSLAQHFKFPEYLPYLSLDSSVVKNNLELVGKYRCYWILLDRQKCIIFASKIGYVKLCLIIRTK
jgi:hypothetical protein